MFRSFLFTPAPTTSAITNFPFRNSMNLAGEKGPRIYRQLDRRTCIKVVFA